MSAWNNLSPLTPFGGMRRLFALRWRQVVAVMERGRGGGAGWAGRMGRGCSGASSLSQSGITAVSPQSSFTLTNEKPPRPHPRVSALLVHSPQVQPPLTPLPGAPVQGRTAGLHVGPAPPPSIHSATPDTSPLGTDGFQRMGCTSFISANQILVFKCSREPAF